MGPQGSRGKRQKVLEILEKLTHNARKQKVKEQCSETLGQLSIELQIRMQCLEYNAARNCLTTNP